MMELWGVGRALATRGKSSQFALVLFFFALIVGATAALIPAPAWAGFSRETTSQGTCYGQGNCPGYPGGTSGSITLNEYWAGETYVMEWCTAGSTAWYCYRDRTWPDPPQPASASAYGGTTPFNTPKTFTPSISNANGLVVVSQPAQGTASASGTTLTYTPPNGYVGTASFTWYATGSGGNSGTVAATITVQAPPVPSVTGGSYSVTYNGGVTHNFAPTNGGVVAIASSPAHGVVSLAGGVATYTANSGYIGADSFTATATNAGGTSTAATVNLTVQAPPAPAITGGSHNVSYEGSVGHDFSPTNGGLVTITSAPAHGSVTLVGGVATYTAAAGYIGSDTFSATATNPGGSSAAAVVTLNVQSPPPPAGASFNGSTAYATPLTFTPSVSGVASSVEVLSQPAGGSAVTAGSSITFAPAAGFVGSTSFNWRAVGPGGNSSSFAATINVLAPPAPTGSAYSGATPFETPLTFTPDVAGVANGLEVVSVTHGAAVASGMNITFTPGAGYFGPATVTWRATGPGGASASIDAEITVGLPSPPTPLAHSGATAFETATTFTPNVTGVSSSVEVVTQPAHGTATAAGSSLTYTPEAEFVGPDSFTWRAIGPGGASSGATASIVVAPPPPPTLAGGSISADFNQAQAFSFSPTLRGVVAIAAHPTHGSLVLSGNVATYSPNTDFIGTDSFSAVATNAGGTSAPAIVTVTVAPPPVPSLNGASLSTPWNTPVSHDPSPTHGGVVSVQQAPQHGTVSLSGAGLTYTPALNYIGGDAFSLIATNLGGSSSPVAVNVTVSAPAAPAVGAKAVSTSFESAVSIPLEVTGQFNTLAIVAAPGHGAVTLNGERAEYQPTNGYYGDDSFTYEATGFGGSSGPASVTIRVVRPDAPIVATVDAATPYRTSVRIPLTVSGLHTRLVLATEPAHGAVELEGDEALYTPSDGYIGLDSFSVTAEGPGGASAPANVVVTVASPGQPVVAPVAAARTPAGRAVTIPVAVSGVFSKLSIISPPSHGTAGVDGLSVVYAPADNYSGSDALTVVAEGAGGTSPPVAINIEVAAPELAPPVAPNLQRDVQAGAAVRIQVIEGMANGPFTAVELVSQPEVGTATVDGLEVVFTAPADFNGQVAFQYRVSNSAGSSVPATITVAVTATPAPPPEKTAVATPDRPATVDLTEGVEGGPFVAAAVVAVSPSQAGKAEVLDGSRASAAAQLAPKGAAARMAAAPVNPGSFTLKFTPAENFFGRVAVRYSLTNRLGRTAEGVVWVEVDTRGDPTTDGKVSALVNAQTQALQRFGSAQIDNVTRHMEGLRAGNPQNALALSAARPTPTLEPGSDPVRARNLEALRGPVGSEEAAGTASQGLGKVPVWIGGAVELGKRDNEGSASGFDFATSGVSVGADLRLAENLWFGAGLGYGRDYSDLGGGSKVTSRAYSGFVYGTYNPAPKMFVDGVIGATRMKSESKRLVDNAGVLSGERQGSEVFGSIGAGMELNAEGVRLSPYGRLEYLSAWLSGFSESGDEAAALRFGGQSISQLTGVFGVTADYTVALKEGVLRPSARVEYRLAAQEAAAARVGYAVGRTSLEYETAGTVYDDRRLTLGVGLDWRSRNGLTLNIGLDGATTPDSNSATIRAGGSGSF